MVSASGRSVIAYNGEVYNFADIRRELEAESRRFRGGSDTEVVLESCETWGVERAVSKFIGMFAFAFWDDHARRLTLVRDRLGIKPLYWGRSGGVLFFGSQPKALVDHPAWRPVVDRDALAAYLRHAYVPAPRSIFQGIEKLEPGSLVEIDAEGRESRRRYWDLRSLARDGVRERTALDDTTAVEALDGLLRDAVKRRMIADVPLGVFLSGGIDSSTVLALMQAQSTRPVKSFTIGFDEAGHDEARYAKQVAEHLGTDHTELYVAPDRALAVLPRLASWYDEPFADSSQIPTYLVSEMTRRDVTVALFGDGGDEVFAGYNRHVSAPVLWRHRARQPSKADGDALYRRLVSQWDDPGSLVRSGRKPQGILWDPTVRHDFPDFTDRMQFLDTVTYLPDDILTKVDRASMAVGLEARVPLLDHRVVEFAWRLPPAMKVRGGQGKWLLRQVLRRYVPERAHRAPQDGFWGADRPLAPGTAQGLGREPARRGGACREGGYFDPAPIRRAWAEHLSGHRNRQHQLWCVLMFESWRETWGIGSA